MIVDNPSSIRSADIVVGIPSLNEADNIGISTDAVARGLQEFFPEHRRVIVNVDTTVMLESPKLAPHREGTSRPREPKPSGRRC